MICRNLKNLGAYVFGVFRQSIGIFLETRIHTKKLLNPEDIDNYIECLQIESDFSSFFEALLPVSESYLYIHKEKYQKINIHSKL